MGIGPFYVWASDSRRLFHYILAINIDYQVMKGLEMEDKISHPSTLQKNLTATLTPLQPGYDYVTVDTCILSSQQVIADLWTWLWIWLLQLQWICAWALVLLIKENGARKSLTFHLFYPQQEHRGPEGAGDEVSVTLKKWMNKQVVKMVCTHYLVCVDNFHLMVLNLFGQKGEPDKCHGNLLAPAAPSHS